MKTIRGCLVAVLALSTIGTAVLAWREYRALVAAKNELAREGGDLRMRLDEAEKRLRSLQDDLKAVRARQAKATAAAATDAPPSRGGGRDWKAAYRMLMNNPEVQKLLAIQQKAQLDARYADLFKTLSQPGALTPEQLAEFKDLLVQKQEAVLDAVQAAREQGLSPKSDPVAYQAAISNAENGIDQQIESTLGASSYSQYQQYEQTLPERNTVSSVQEGLSYSSTPLTDQQASQLVQIFQQDEPQPSGSGGSSVRSILNSTATAPITQQVLTDASNVLSPPQLAELQVIQQQQAAQQQLQQMLHGGRSGGKG